MSKTLGNLGEQMAADYLERNGHIIERRNYRCRVGEIDIVSRAGDYIVFTEVKSRKSKSHGRPAEAVVYGKIQKIRRVAESYIQARGLYDIQPRFDVVEVMVEGSGYRINHIENAF